MSVSWDKEKDPEEKRRGYGPYKRSWTDAEERWGEKKRAHLKTVTDEKERAVFILLSELEKKELLEWRE